MDTITSTGASLEDERRHEVQAALAGLAKQRTKRTYATFEESIAVAAKLAEKFSGLDLITALAAEGFGNPRQVREAANILSR